MKSWRPLLFFGFLALLLAACAQGYAQILAETTEFNFGDVNIGEIVTRDITISNTGSGVLLIESITTSCGCTTAETDAVQIQPGDSTTLHIIFDSGAHGDTIAFYTRQVFVASNDPQQPELRIQFTANVIRGSN